MNSNPWQVDSIQTFYCLKCPECMFFSHKEFDFRHHAMENHPLSYLLFGKSENNEEMAQHEEKSDIDENYENVLSTSINSNSLIENTMIEKESFDSEIKVNNDLKLIEMNEEYFVPTMNLKDDNTIVEDEKTVHLESSEGIKVEENSETVFVENLDMKEEYSEELDNQNDPIDTLAQPESDGMKMKSDTKSEILQEKKPYKCPKCDMYFSYPGIDMKNHIKLIHEGKKPFQVSIFSESFKTNKHLKSHTLHQHKRDTSHTCSICDTNFSQKSKLKKHKELVHKGKENSETVITVNLDLTKEHLEELNNQNDHFDIFSQSESECIRIKSDSNSKILQEKKPYKCPLPLCDMYFSYPGIEMKEHIRLIHKRKQKSKLHEGIKTIKTFLCDICNKAFETNSAMIKHVLSVHEGKKPFKCESCGSSYTQKSSLDVHIKLVHEGIKDFLCDICNKAFGKKSAVKKHVSEVHEGKKLFKCELCGSRFTQKNSLDGHIKWVHEGIETFLCDICNKVFGTNSTMKKHVSSVHEGKKLFKCERCGSSFTQKGNLDGHIKLVHEGIKNFLCDICNKAFGTKSAMKKHVALVHEGKRPFRFKCESCGSSFTQKSFLDVHIKSMHDRI